MSWDNAYTDLQDALDEVAVRSAHLAGIWVAAGSGPYLPSELSDPGDPQSAIRRRILPADHPATSDALVILGQILVNSSREKTAEQLLREAVGIRERALPENHWQTASARSILGQCLTAHGWYEEAEPLLLHSHTALEMGRPALAGESARRIIECYTAWGRPEEAAKWRAKLADARATTQPTSRPTSQPSPENN